MPSLQDSKTPKVGMKTSEVLVMRIEMRCLDCGLPISLERKMPSGHWVALDVGIERVHRCRSAKNGGLGPDVAHQPA